MRIDGRSRKVRDFSLLARRSETNVSKCPDRNAVVWTGREAKTLELAGSRLSRNSVPGGECGHGNAAHPGNEAQYDGHGTFSVHDILAAWENGVSSLPRTRGWSTIVLENSSRFYPFYQFFVLQQFCRRAPGPAWSLRPGDLALVGWFQSERFSAPHCGKAKPRW
jgi:hypothetical protein